MIYTNAEYFLFFPVVLLGAFLLRGRAHMVFLTVTSYIFYGAWNPPFALLLLLTTVVDFQLSIVIGNSTGAARRRFWMWCSVVLNLSLLGYFKYANFFVDSAVSTLTWMGFTPSRFVLEVTLPAGISFYTFQSMSYILDVYFRRLKPTQSLLDYACFVAFFPQLVAGPIVRAGELIPQFTGERRVGEPEIREGLRLLFRGFVKKAFVADTLGVLMVDPVFQNPAQYGTLTHWLAMIAYTAQVYGDFSGYTDMGRGSAKLMGFDLPINFKFPYITYNPRDYWRRNHITLTTWLRDYLFFSLERDNAQNRRAVTLRNVFITFVLGGLWHGARWTFVLWGVFHALWIALHSIYSGWLDGIQSAKTWRNGMLYRGFCRVCTFALLVTSLVFFRSQSLDQAWVIIRSMYGLSASSVQLISGQVLLLIAAMAFTHLWSLVPSHIRYMERVPLFVKDIGHGLIIVYMLINLIGGARPFIYFQF